MAKEASSSRITLTVLVGAQQGWLLTAAAKELSTFGVSGPLLTPKMEPKASLCPRGGDILGLTARSHCQETPIEYTSEMEQ
jgi:hypothetical protein